MAQVYAVVHDGQGNFLIGKKKTYGYFFHYPPNHPSRRIMKKQGQIVPSGQLLNGFGLSALPGGDSEGQDAETAARREFLEETGVALGDYQFEKSPAPLQGQGYSGVYFKVSTSDLGKILDRCKTNLSQSQAASADVQVHQVTSWDAMRKRWPSAPLDDELAGMYRWNLTQDANSIAELKNNSNTNWFPPILAKLG